MQHWPYGPKKPLLSEGFRAKITCPTVAALTVPESGIAPIAPLYD